MIAEAPPAESDLTRRYALAKSPEWQRVARHFELGEGFAFIVLLVPDADGAMVCRREVERLLAALGRTLHVLPVPHPDDIRSLAQALLPLVPPAEAGAVWVEAVVPEGSPDVEEWKAAWREGSARLNQFRNPLRRQLHVTLFFVGAPWLQEVLRGMAPDLWSVRTLVAHLEPEPAPVTLRPETAPPLPRMVAPEDAPDPEFALQMAEPLRGRMDPEARRQLADLLHRAGEGFIARYQWPEAIAALEEAVALREELAPESRDLAASLARLGEALAWGRDRDRAAEHLSRAEGISRAAGDGLPAECR